MNATFPAAELVSVLSRWLQEWAPSEARWTTISLIFNMEIQTSPRPTQSQGAAQLLGHLW